MKLSIIVPVYNEEKTIIEVLEKLLTVTISKIKIEIVVVNDGSTDNTKKKLKKFSNSKSISIYHKGNGGKGTAVVYGINKATGDYVIIQDADLEYDPSQISSLVSAITKEHRVIYGTRLARLPHFDNEERRLQFFLHYIGNRFLSLITSLLYGQWITDMETCYKLFPKMALKGKTIQARGFEFEPEITALLIKSGYKIKEIPITTKPRGYDEGKKLHTVRDGLKAIKAIVKFRFAS